MDDIADATREVSRVLDDTDVMGEQAYTLEVSSPGVDRPLTLPRHWRRNTGRLVKVSPVEGEPVTGRITATRRRRRGPRRRGHRAAGRLRRREEGQDPDRVQEGDPSDGHRHEPPADARAGEGDSLRRARRGHRAGPADGVPQDQRRPGARARRARQEERPRHGDGARSTTRRATTSGSTTTPPRASAGSPPRPRSRSCSSACATPRTSGSSVSSPARRATSSPGLIQQGRNPDDVMVDLGKLEALLPAGERVPGEDYSHGTRIKCLVVSVRKGMRGPQVMLSRTHPNLVKKLFALEVPEIADGTVEIHGIAREAGHRTKIAVHVQRPRRERQGLLHRPDGPAGAQRDERAARREDRHRRLVRRARPPWSPTRSARPASPR